VVDYHFWPCGENCAEVFGIWEAESGKSKGSIIL